LASVSFTIVSARPQTQPPEDRELDCRTARDAALCRQLQGNRAPRAIDTVPIYQIPAQSSTGIPRPSFECADAVTTIERLICSDPELTQLDGRMGEAFKRRYASLPEDQRGAFLEDQRYWIALRNARCSRPGASAQPCILQLTQERVATLA